MKTSALLLGLALSLLSLPLLNAQTLEVTGEVTTPLKLTLADLELLPHRTVKAREHSGEEAEFSGVPVYQLLKQAGVPLGETLRGKAVSLYLLVVAADGYQAVIALPEMDPLFNENAIILADQKNGQPLDASIGPLRMVLPEEKRHARWVRQVIRLEVHRANASAATPNPAPTKD